MRLKKYKNLPSCKPTRIPYDDEIDYMFTLLNDIHPHKNSKKLLDGIIKTLEKVLQDVNKE